MTNFNIDRARRCLQEFRFHDLFIDELGWEQPARTVADTLNVDGVDYGRRQIAQLAGVVVFELTAADGLMPEAAARVAVQRRVAEQYHEHLLIFLDQARSQSLWYWVKREGTKRQPRSHYYVKGQTGDLFMSKISAMFVDMSELDDEGRIPVVEVARRLKAALDIERVTKKFFDEFKLAHTRFLGYIAGIADERDRRWYTSVILNRLMFTWFLQGKGFLDNGNHHYLPDKLEASQAQAADHYYEVFLKTLFFDGFARPEAQRDPATRRLIGRIRYLNGGLFLKHPIEEKYDRIAIPDDAFSDLYHLFSRYSWNLNDSVGGQDDEINPDVLGYIFEKYINQKEFGAYYTRPEITEYLCEQTIHKLILDRLAELNQPIPGLPAPPRFESIGELILNLDAERCSQLIHQILPNLSLLDPAAGSGAFLVAALKTLTTIYQGVIGRIRFLKDGALRRWLEQQTASHPSLDYFIKKKIITDNLYGVDIMAEAVEIARLRLFLALVASAQSVDDLEPLPNIDFNILPGNSLIGLLRVDETAFNRQAQSGGGTGQAAQLGIFAALGATTYREIVAEKNRLIGSYKNAAAYTDNLQTLRDNILDHRRRANDTLNRVLLDEFLDLGIKFEEATWDVKKNEPGRAKKRTLQLSDIEALQPFHWGYEFNEIMNERGGFDAIISNPPWDVLQSDEKEFFQEFVPTIQKKNLRIEDWNKQKNQLMKDPELRAAWLDYASSFSHISQYLKKAEQYKNQLSVINGRKAGSKINLYSYFLELSYHLLGDQGFCGIIVPAGIYTDLSTKQLRELLFSQNRLIVLVGLSNEKFIFDTVHHAQKFSLLIFEKGDKTEEGRTADNRGHKHQVSMSSKVSFEGRPRCMGGDQRGGGMRKSNSSTTDQR